MPTVTSDRRFVRISGFGLLSDFVIRISSLSRAPYVACYDFMNNMAGDPMAEFITAACAPLDSGHTSGTLDRAEAILAAYSGLATSAIHPAVILGDAAAVRWFLAADPANATAKGAPLEGR